MSDSDSDSDIPPREVCEERCQEFAAVTGTDTALAMFFLQDRQWDLQKAVSAYFDDQGGKGGGDAVPMIIDPESGATNGKQSSSATTGDAGRKESSPAEDPEPHRIRLMSWNIDGLDQNNVKNRAKGVAQTILKEKPDVVFLQEVVDANLGVLEEHCPMYHVVPGGKHPSYFTAILLKVDSVVYKESTIEPFFSSMMDRNLLTVTAKVKGLDMTLMTSHLESTKDHGAQRKKQLQAAFKAMQKADPQQTFIFGGDLNLRDKELAEIGGLPDGILDLWEVTGKRPEARYTWDMTKNDNLELPFKVKCRFDRLYMQPSKPTRQIKPVYFELIGLERLKSCHRFPSDHWGLLAHFDKT